MKERFAKDSEIRYIRSMWLIFNSLNVRNLDIYKKLYQVFHILNLDLSVIKQKVNIASPSIISFKRKYIRKSKMKSLILTEIWQSWI